MRTKKLLSMDYKNFDAELKKISKKLCSQFGSD